MKLNEVHNIDEAMMAGGQEAYATEAKPDAYTRDQMAATAGFGRRPREHDTGDDEPKGVFTVVIDGRDWKTATSNEAFRMANAVAHKHPGKRVQVRWPTGQLNTVAEGLAMGMEEEFVGEPEHDGSTFKNSLHTIHRVAVYLNKNISDDDDIPEWVAEKMGAAKGMLTSVMQYLISEKEMHHGEADIYEQGVAEGLPQTLRKVVPGYAKREIDKKMDAGKFGKTDVDKDANYYRYKKIQDKLKEQGVAEGQGNFDTAINNLHGWYEVDSSSPDIKEYEFDDREGGYYAQGTVKYSMSTGRVKIEFEDRSGQYGDDVNQTFNSIGDAMNVLRTITTQYRYNNGKAQKFDRLSHREPVTPDKLRKTDRTGRKGTISGAHSNDLKYSIQNNKGKLGPKGVLPEGQGVAEGHADQQRKIFKKNGEPVGEVGIDRESSPGVGQWYMKCYANGIDNVGYDSYEEAVAELKHCLRQGVAEGWKDVIAGGAMALGALGAGAQTMPNINAQQVALTNQYYNVLVQRAKEDGKELDRRTLNFLKAKAEDAAALKLQKSAPNLQQGFHSQGSERRVSSDIDNFESQGVAEGNYSDEANPIRDDGNEPPDYAAMYENKLVEFAGGMGTGSVATAPGVGKGSNVGSLFGGSYSQKNSPFKKTKAKKESVIKR